METYRTIIDLEEAFKRSSDVFNISNYPRSIWDAKGILVKEDRSVIPSYQQMPSGISEVLVENLCENRVITPQKRDKKIREMYEQCGALDSPKKMFRIDKVVYGLSDPNLYGSNAYFSTLILSEDLLSKEPHAITVGTEEWDYKFMPGTFRIGRTGRILEDAHKQTFNEEIHMKITPDFVWDAVTNGGLFLDKVGIVKNDDTVEVVYDKEKAKYGYLKEKFPKPPSLKFKYKNTQFKEIDLTKIAESKGMHVVNHPFCEKISEMEEIYVFNTGTKFESLSALTSHYSSITDNVVWKLAALQRYTGHSMNNFLQRENAQFGEYVIYPSKAHVSLGHSGRSLKIDEGWAKGCGEIMGVAQHLDERGRRWNLIPNWQSEYIEIKLDTNLLLSALFELGEDEFRQLIMCAPPWDAPWEIVYDSKKGIRPENKVRVPEELLKVPT